MRLKLYRKDLKPEFDFISCSQTKFLHFNEAAQNAIRAVGQGTFFDGEGSSRETYNVVYPESTS